MGGKTKSDQIRALYAELKGTVPEHKIMAAIAERIGCTRTYARVVARQRGDGTSAADKRYRAQDHVRERYRVRYGKDTPYRARLLAQQRETYRKRRGPAVESV